MNSILSPLDLVSALLTGQTEKLNISSYSAADVAEILLQNLQIVMILTTSVAVLIGCVVVRLVWRRYASMKSRVVEPVKPLIVKEPEVEVDDRKKKVPIFYGTQTGTADRFAKALAEEAKARYEKDVFKVVDLDDYAADDEEYEAKLKKESIAFFFLAT
ncbi:unnamed protein product [Rhodiola kirilowii]